MFGNRKNKRRLQHMLQAPLFYFEEVKIVISGENFSILRSARLVEGAFSGTAQGADPLRRDVLPQGTRGNPVLREALRLIIDEAADGADIGFHSIGSSLAVGISYHVPAADTVTISQKGSADCRKAVFSSKSIKKDLNSCSDPLNP